MNEKRKIDDTPHELTSDHRFKESEKGHLKAEITFLDQLIDVSNDPAIGLRYLQEGFAELMNIDVSVLDDEDEKKFHDDDFLYAKSKEEMIDIMKKEQIKLKGELGIITVSEN